ncbi:MAG: hypothetical protein U0169_24880 [Polyangiaceae bacterium]
MTVAVAGLVWGVAYVVARVASVVMLYVLPDALGGMAVSVYPRRALVPALFGEAASVAAMLAVSSLSAAWGSSPALLAALAVTVVAILAEIDVHVRRWVAPPSRAAASPPRCVDGRGRPSS